MTEVTAPSDQSQYLTFGVHGEEYGIGVLLVREILRYDVVTRVPTTPPWIRGVINVRGNVVPVVDLAVKLGLPESPTTRLTCIVIAEVEVNGEVTVMGVIADAVNQVVDLRPEDIEPPPTFGTRIRVDYLIGMAEIDQKFILILDINQLLSADELVVVQAAAQAEPAGESGPAGGGEVEGAGEVPETEDESGESRSRRKRRKQSKQPMEQRTDENAAPAQG